VTQEIGDAVVSAIEEVTISTSASDDEIDLTDEDKNIVFNGEESSEEIDIAFVLVNQGIVDIEEEKERLKDVAREDVDNNYFDYLHYDDWISVEDVSFSEEGSESNIKTGTISGYLLPYPQKSDGIKGLLFFGEIDASLDLEGDVHVGITFDGSVEGTLSASGDVDVGKILSSDVGGVLSFGSNYSSNAYGDGTYGEDGVIMNVLKSISTNVQSSLEIKSGLYSSSYGLSYSGSSEPKLSLSLVLDGSFDFVLDSSGTLEKASEIGYTFDYGDGYGGLVYDYGSGMYGTGVYGE